MRAVVCAGSATPSSTDAPGVEPAATVAARAAAAFRALVAEASGGPIVLVAHDAINRPLLHSVDPSLVDIPQRTGCWNQLTFVDGRWQVDAYDRMPPDN